MDITPEQWEKQLEYGREYLQKRMAEIKAETDFAELERQEQLLNERVYRAGLKYQAAGLGEPMELGFWKEWPKEALDYPGGPVAVYEEAMRRGVTWEEVCGYQHGLYGKVYVD